MTRDNGASSSTFKSAIIWVAPEGVAGLVEDARKLLAWEDIADEIDSGTLKLDDGQQKQLDENLKRASRDLKEAIWRSYKNLVLLGKDNKLREIDLGLVHSSAADSMLALILDRLRKDGDIEKDVSPNFLVRNWPPAFNEWSTKSVRDAFFASPQFPKLLNADAVKDAIARGVSNRIIAYVGKLSNGEYQPFTFGGAMATGEEKPKQTDDPTATPRPDPGPAPNIVTSLIWIGDIPPQKWTTFYTKVLTKFAVGKGLRLTLSLNVNSEDGISAQKIEETKAALLELGLDDKIDVE